MANRFPQPKTADEFEDICLAVLKVHWACETLVRYGKTGDTQHGIDIIDRSGATPIRVAQCKLHEPHKKLSMPEVRAEVEKLKGFDGHVAHYLILTTASRSTTTDDAVREINSEHLAEGLFQVEVQGWDWICEILEANSQLLKTIYPSFYGAIQAQVLERLLSSPLAPMVSASHAQTDASTEQADERDADIDDARELFKRGELTSARIQLERLRTPRVWAKLTPHQKFRVATNLAVFFQVTDNRHRVAELLEEGASYEPDTEKSAANRIIALELRAKPEEAFAAALEMIDRFPASAAAVAARVRSAPSDTSWDQLLGWVAPEFEGDGAVGIAVAMRALHLGHSEEAATWATRAIEFPGADAPSIAQARVVRARAMIHVALRDAWLDGGDISDGGRQSLREAADLLSQVIAAMSGCGSLLAGEAYAHRSEAHEFLGDEAASLKDAEEAGRLAPENPIVLLRLGEKYVVVKEWDLAVRTAKRAVELEVGPVALHLLARALRARNEPGDRSDAADILVDLARIKELRRPDPAVREATNALCEAARIDEAWAFLEEMSRALGLSVHSHRTSLAIATRDIARAASEAALVLPAWRTLDGSEQRAFAAALVELKDDANALSVLLELHQPNVLTRETGMLLDCAMRLGRHDLAMELSAALRQSGVRDQRVLRIELNLLSRYAPSRAVEVLLRHVDENPADRELRLHLSILGHCLNRRTLISSAAEHLPLVAEASPEIVRQVVHLLQEVGEAGRAIEYAYAFLRRHFGSAQAHRTFVEAVLGRDVPLVEHTRVGPHTAVRYRDEATRQDQWIVIELSDASAERNEEGPEGALASKLLGHEVGERVVLSRGAVQDRAVTILAVVENITFRLNDCMNKFQIRFPDEPGFQLIDLALPGAAPESEEIDPEPLLKMGRGFREERERLVAWYCSKRAPVFSLCNVQHLDEVDAWTLVISSAELPVHCCDGSQAEWEAAVAATRSCREVVLDIGAVLGVNWLELRDVLTAWPVTRLVTLSTVQALRSHKSQLQRGAASDPERVKAVREMDAFLHFVLENCEHVDTPELAVLSPETRHSFIERFGLANAESIAAARHPGRVLWSDQICLEAVERKELGVLHAWTQAVVHARYLAGALTSDRVETVNARLLAMRYESTRFGARTIVASAVSARWDPTAFPFKQNLDELVSSRTSLNERFPLVLLSIVALCSEAQTPEVRSIVIIAILERLALRPHGSAVIDRLHRELERAFGLNALRGLEAKHVVGAWRASRQA